MYTIKEFAKVVGEPESAIQYWVDEGRLVPAYEDEGFSSEQVGAYIMLRKDYKTDTCPYIDEVTFAQAIGYCSSVYKAVVGIDAHERALPMTEYIAPHHITSDGDAFYSIEQVQRILKNKDMVSFDEICVMTCQNYSDTLEWLKSVGYPDCNTSMSFSRGIIDKVCYNRLVATADGVTSSLSPLEKKELWPADVLFKKINADYTDLYAVFTKDFDMRPMDYINHVPLWDSSVLDTFKERYAVFEGHVLLTAKGFSHFVGNKPSSIGAKDKAGTFECTVRDSRGRCLYTWDQVLEYNRNKGKSDAWLKGSRKTA